MARTRLDLVKQRDIPPLAQRLVRRHMRDDVQVLDMWDLLVERGEFVEVGREQAEGVYLRCDVSMIRG